MLPVSVASSSLLINSIGWVGHNLFIHFPLLMDFWIVSSAFVKNKTAVSICAQVFV